jgi:hypothetical protein
MPVINCIGKCSRIPRLSHHARHVENTSKEGRAHNASHLTGLIDQPILVLKSFMRKKQVLPVLHVGERIMTRLLYGFAGDQTVHDQCNEAYSRHGVEDWEDPSEPWIARRPSF